VTSAADGLAHDVVDTEVLIGRPRGRYVAVCGAIVHPTALTAPAGRVCRSCAGLRVPDPTEESMQPARAARRAQSRWLATCSAIMRGTLHRPAVVWS
jgi:hypothetical protein